jgi:hypothetical protein
MIFLVKKMNILGLPRWVILTILPKPRLLNCVSGHTWMTERN